MARHSTTTAAMAFSRPLTNHHRSLSLLAVVAALLVDSAAAIESLPYKPTTLLTLSDTVYALQDRSFASFNVSETTTISTSPTWTNITDSLPFVGDADTSTYAAAIANDTLLVYAGDCKDGGGSIWVYDPSATQWNRKTVANGTDDAPYMLGGAIGFASTIDPESQIEPDVYAFGGMCGTPSTSVWAWQSSSDYTSHMIRLSTNPVSASSNYNASDLTLPNTPVAAAGFTWTATTPAIASKASSVSQQVDYVMIGGHTNSAFVNMSSVALWSLPDEAWSFVSVNSYRNISSRSGHTTVLSDDGTSLVLMGGWVGQITRAADPQLVILEMSDSDKGWKWTVPKNQPSGSGIYGHGATVLPGNVLMVYGGYDISSSTKRSVSGSSMFYNMTSGEWSDSYTNPDASTSTATSTSSASTTASNTASTTSTAATATHSSNPNSSRNLAIGLGLGIGIPLLLILIVVGLCLYRRRRSKKSRDDTIRALAQDESHFLHTAAGGEMTQPGGASSWFTRPDPSYVQARATTHNSAYESVRGNDDDNADSPIEGRQSTQLPRSAPGGSYDRPGSSRGGYMPATSNDPIDPIYENEPQDTAYDRPRTSHMNKVPNMVNIHQPPPMDDGTESESELERTPIAPRKPKPAIKLSGAPTNFAVPPLSPRDREVNDWIQDLEGRDDLLARLEHGKAGSAEIRNALAAVEGRPNSSSSTPSYNTARSQIVGVAAEGLNEPTAAYGSGSRAYNQVPNNDQYYEDDIPGSPSKSQPRHSWLGSLRRVFSGRTESNNSSMIQGDGYSPTRDGPADGFLAGNDYEQRITGMPRPVGANGTLLPRKRGRQAWDDMPAHIRGRVEDGNDWAADEQAVEQRLVQVMYTVPDERHDAGNAELSREEEVVVVNPEDGEDASLVSNAGEISGVGETESESGDYGASARYRRPSGVRFASSSSTRPAAAAGLRGGASDDRLRMSAKRSFSPLVTRGRSPFVDSSDTSSVTRYSTELRTAELVRMEKPKSRVRAMVDAFEGRSRDNSPVHSLK